MRQTVRKNPAECTGCGACVSICPKQAIVMQPDTEGFLYPKVDGEKCISCDLCEKRCPAGPGDAGASCAAVRQRRRRRSSFADILVGAAVFTLLAREVIRRAAWCLARRLAKTCALNMSAHSMKRSFPECAVPSMCRAMRRMPSGQRGFAAEKGDSGAVFRHTVPDKRAAGRVG